MGLLVRRFNLHRLLFLLLLLVSATLSVKPPHPLDSIKSGLRHWRDTAEGYDVDEQAKRVSGSIGHGRDFLDLYYYDPGAHNTWALHGAKEYFADGLWVASNAPADELRYMRLVCEAYHYLVESIDAWMRSNYEHAEDRFEGATATADLVPDSLTHYKAHLLEHVQLHRETMSLSDNHPDTVAHYHMQRQYKVQEEHGPDAGIARAAKMFRQAREDEQMQRLAEEQATKRGQE